MIKKWVNNIDGIDRPILRDKIIKIMQSSVDKGTNNFGLNKSSVIQKFKEVYYQIIDKYDFNTHNRKE